MAATHWRGALAPEMSSPSAVTGEVWQPRRLRHAHSHRRRMMSGRDGRGMAFSEGMKQEEVRTVADVSQPAVLQAFQRRDVVPAQPAACMATWAEHLARVQCEPEHGGHTPGPAADAVPAASSLSHGCTCRPGCARCAAGCRRSTRWRSAAHHRQASALMSTAVA